MTQRHRLLPLCILLVGACDSEDDTADGSVASTLPSTDQCSGVVTALDGFTSGLFSDVDLHSLCSAYAREISTGVTLGPSSGEVVPWNRLGGRGELMADAAMCLLADLGNYGGEGHVVSQAPFGPFRTRQILGQEHFDPDSRSWRGYQRIEMCAPLLDCFDVSRQIITVDQVSSPSYGTTGPYPIEDAYALRVTTQPSDLDFTVSLGEVTIPSPVGPLTFAPTFTYGRHTSTIDTPFDHVDDTLHYFRREAQRLQDTNGRDAQGLIVSSHPASYTSKGGWVSQLGFGQRGGSGDAFAPGGTIESQVRPDIDLPSYEDAIAASATYDFSDTRIWRPRNGDETEPVMTATLAADIGYDLTSLIPLDLGAFVEQADLVLRPHASIDFAGQTQLVVREGDPRASEFDEIPETQALLQGVSAASGDYGIEAHLDLVLGFGFVTVEIHRSFDVPLLEDSTAKYGASELAFATSRSEPDHDPALFSAHTWSGNGNASSLISECLASNPPDTTIPDPVVTDWDQPLFDQFPCNLCIHKPATSDSAAMDVLLMDFGDPQWTCNSQHQGCVDMCRFDPASGEPVEIVRSAADDPSLCDPGPS